MYDERTRQLDHQWATYAVRRMGHEFFTRMEQDRRTSRKGVETGRSKRVNRFSERRITH